MICQDYLIKSRQLICGLIKVGERLASLMKFCRSEDLAGDALEKKAGKVAGNGTKFWPKRHKLTE